jgi:hypothetical protein
MNLPSYLSKLYYKFYQMNDFFGLSIVQHPSIGVQYFVDIGHHSFD